MLLGCMRLGGEGDRVGSADIAAAEAAVGAALEAGITVFDLADIYRGGRSETVFGEVLRRAPGLRERIVIQTKCGIRLADADMPGHYDLRGASIRRRVEQSLRRLGVDAIDILLLHRPDPLADPADVGETLDALRTEGLVRRFGVSNMSAPQIALLQAHLSVPFTVNQLQMSLRHRDWLEAGVLVNTAEAAANGFPLGTVEHCVANGIALQAWEPLAQGRYTGRQETPAEVATARLVADLARDKGTTPETVVLWWLRRHPAGITPVIGSTRPSRIAACADAVRRPPELTHEEWYRLWVTARGAKLP
ncbi:aldo/keto reductase [Phytohabitans houttuyneae]|uniref:Aldo/keto reductase n=1 Tax=Phytohabitans houttuyneae TaxID=1076126 RepID=A0A6V8KLC3_9ACTN|nr:aldo/keto reductase [Phytohabitans houttuyneae]GFJ82736.1 aldo/keto reductase [Phytohabitans houttuyneae]